MVKYSLFFTLSPSLSLPLSLFLSRDGIASRTGGVDISDLTWEQKEQCLRLVFAKMNRRKTASSAKSLQGTMVTQQPALPAPPTKSQHAESASTPSVFITEQSRGQGTEGGMVSDHVQTALEQVT